MGDQSITYDSQGNPLSYLGHTLTWEKGRQLKSFDNIRYTYNANGIRTSKTVGSVKHTYTLDGTKILSESWNSNVLVPLYDNEENVCGILYNNTPYYFLKNLQGDVIAITNKNGSVVAKYSYDAWGVCTVTQDSSGCNIANINPFQYRSYYFDTETNLYYLQSRYYDPVVGQFLNADDAQYILSDENLFKYCYNSPINDTDPLGYSPGQLFTSSQKAAYDFAKLYYAITLYIYFEIGCFLYSKRQNGKTYYSYTNYVIGTPHNCTITGSIPKNATIIGTIHTHPPTSINT